MSTYSFNPEHTGRAAIATGEEVSADAWFRGDLVAMNLPSSRIDTLLETPSIKKWWFLFKAFWRSRYDRVALPKGLPGAHLIPAYVLQNYHNLPNGNYSKKISRGYIRGFDLAMLGEMIRARQHLARSVTSATRLLDVGCGGGRMAAELHKVDGVEVWGVDPSPYLLQHAATDYPGVHFLQGVAEQLDFPDRHFDAVTACFLFHEMPPKYVRKALAEIKRVLKPGGLLSFCEPSAIQYTWSYARLLKAYGWRGVYFGVFSRIIHEPFLAAWHRMDKKILLKEAGFEVVALNDQMPITCMTVRKPIA